MEKAKYFVRYAPDPFWDFRRAVKLTMRTYHQYDGIDGICTAIIFFCNYYERGQRPSESIYGLWFSEKKIECARHCQPQTGPVSIMLLRNLRNWNRKSD